MASSPAAPLSFGALLKTYRRLARLTQEQLAERAGFSPSHISMLERGERMPVAATVEMLVAALDLEMAQREALFAAMQRVVATTVERAQDAWGERWRQGREHAAAAAVAVAEDDQPTPTWPVGGFLGVAPEGPLVAREAEMRQLLAALDALLAAPPANVGRLVMLSGEAGIGKTRLAQELALRARERGMLVATGRCYERQQTAGFAPIGEALGMLQAAAPARVRAEAADRWPEVLALLPDTPLVAAPAPTAPTAPALATEQVARERVFRQMAGFVAAVAASRPLLLMLDDLHWADGASLDALLHLARLTRGARVLLLGTYREQEVRRQPLLRATLLDLVHERLVERIALRPLAQDETAALMAAALGPGAFDADLVELIYTTTQGNPFFVQEVVRALAERGEIVHEAGGQDANNGGVARWRHAAGASGRRHPSEVALPQSVRDTLNERVARLSPLARAVLRQASVLGMVFTLDPLPHMGGWPLGEVETALEEALAAELIRESTGLEYQFSHALTQLAIYGAIPATRRRHMHRAAGEALEQLRASERLRRAAELTQHFLRGDAPERALPYAIQAGDQAVRVYAHLEAEQHYSLALDLAQDLGDQQAAAVARERRADVRYLLGRMDDAYADLAAASYLYRAAREWDRLTWSTCQLAKVCDALGRVPESMRLVEELLDTLLAEVPRQSSAAGAAEHAPPLTLAARTDLASTILSATSAARLVLCITARFVHLGRFAEALEFSAPSILRARQADEPRLESLACSFCATAQQALGQLDAAIHSLEGARRAAEASGDLEARFMAYGTLAVLHETRAEPRMAHTNLLQAVEALTQLDDTERRGAILDELARNAFVLGDWGAARAHWLESLAVGPATDMPMRRLVELALLWLDLAEGKRPLAATLATDPLLRARQQSDLALQIEALRRLTEAHLLAGLAAGPRALIHAVQPGVTRLPYELLDLSEIDMLRAWVELELGDEAAAAQVLAQARQEADARQNRAVYADLWRVVALLALRQQRWDEASHALDQALALCRAMPYPYAEAKALYVYGQLHAARGEPDQACARYQAALALCARLGERLYAERIERALAAL